MSVNKVFHSVSAQNVKSSTQGQGHKAFDTIDFLLDFEGRKAQLNTFRLEGDIRFYSTGTTRVANTDLIGYDNQTGIHSIIESISTELINVGMIENFSGDYGRYVKMQNQASKTSTDYLNADDVASLIAPSNQIANDIACGECFRNTTAGVNTGATSDVFSDISFSFKPMIAVNNADIVNGGSTLSYRKSGTVKVSITLQRDSNVFFGASVDANANYEICNLKMYYCSVVDDGKDEPLMLRTTHPLKHQIVSGNTEVKAKVPSVVSGVSCSFLQQTNENNLTSNALACERPPQVTSVEFNFNDNTNRFISYSIERERDLLQKYLRSLGSSGNNQVCGSKLQDNDGYGIGISFDAPVDLSQSTFNTTIRSGLSSALPFIFYQYFHGILNL